MDGGAAFPQDDRKVTAATTKREKKWYFTSDQLRKSQPTNPMENLTEAANKDAWYRLQCAELVQFIGSRLRLPQIAINTAILYMHRFYQFHSMKRFHRETMAPVFVFLAAKVEETPRRLDDVVRQTYRLLNVDGPELEVESEKYCEQVQDLTTHENVLLQTLAFDLSVTHPHTHVIQCCQALQSAMRSDEKMRSSEEKLRSEKDLSHAAYALASCSLHYTLLCIQYSPVMVAAMCIHVASRWTKVSLPAESQEGKGWFQYMDPNLTIVQIEKVTRDFLDAIEQYPDRVRQKIFNQVLGTGKISANGSKAVPATGAVPGVVNKSVTAVQDPAKRTQTPATVSVEVPSHSKLGLQVPSTLPPQKAGEAHPPMHDRPRPSQPPPPPPPAGAKRPVPAPPSESRAVPPQDRQPNRPQQGVLPSPSVVRFSSSDVGRELYEHDGRHQAPHRSGYDGANGPRSDRPVNSNSKRPSDSVDTAESASKKPRTGGT